MNIPAHKKDFQLERLILFSDAVFAIAITLLVIEIKVPEIHGPDVTEHSLISSLLFLIPKFIGFIISFLVIGQYWTVHHRIFGYVVAYDNRLLWINILFLLAVAMMPFSTAFYSEYIIHLKNTPTFLYIGNIVLLSMMNLWLLLHISNPKRQLSKGLENPVLRRYYIVRSFTVPSIFLLMGVAYLINPVAAILVPPALPLMMMPIQKYFRRKLKQEGIS